MHSLAFPLVALAASLASGRHLPGLGYTLATRRRVRGAELRQSKAHLLARHPKIGELVVAGLRLWVQVSALVIGPALLSR